MDGSSIISRSQVLRLSVGLTKVTFYQPIADCNAYWLEYACEDAAKLTAVDLAELEHYGKSTLDGVSKG